LALEHSYFASDSEDYMGELQPLFSNFHSAGFGVIYDCDLDPNQINLVNSCFFEGDLRGVERTFGDSFLEVFSPRDGASVLPYLAEEWFGFGLSYEPGGLPWANFSVQHRIPRPQDVVRGQRLCPLNSGPAQC